MKKLIAVLLAAVLVLGLAACGNGGTQVLNNNNASNGSAPAANTNNSGNTAPSGNTGNNSSQGSDTNTGAEKVTFAGQNVFPGNAFDASKIKEEAKVMEIPSCALAGTDTVYTYKDVEVTVSEYKGSKVIYSTYFLTNQMKTEKGITIGSSKADVEKAYGTGYKNVGTQYEYAFDDATVSFIIEGDRVTSITYTLKIN